MNTLFGWANTVAFQVGQEKILWTDLVGSLTAILVVLLATKRWLITWPVQILSCVLLFAASLSAHLGGNAARQVVIAVIAGYGWWKWIRGRKQQEQVPVRWAHWPERIGMLVGLVVGTAGFAWLLSVTHASYAPLPDAYIFIGSLVAFYGQARGWVEFWFVWILVDMVGVPLAYTHGLVVYASTYVVFFALCLMGIYAWARKSRTAEPKAAEPEGAKA
jgi:nicotinamide mononucleotide transporter